jgi:hypothetical protein
MYIWIWKTPGGRISGWGPHGLDKGTKSQFTSNRETKWTDPVTARRVPSKWIKGNKGSKGLIGCIQPVSSHVYNRMPAMIE